MFDRITETQWQKLVYNDTIIDKKKPISAFLYASVLTHIKLFYSLYIKYIKSDFKSV